MNEQYKASDGTVWSISGDAKPIPVRHFDWSATDQDYEPGEKIAYGATKEECIASIERIIYEFF